MPLFALPRREHAAWIENMHMHRDNAIVKKRASPRARRLTFLSLEDERVSGNRARD